MLQSEIPATLLSLLYASVTDGSKWQNFCDELNRVATVPIMMFGHNLGSDESLGIIAGGLDPVELDRYHAHFADQNPWMHMNIVMPVGMVGVSDQALAREDLIRTEFYNDWLRPQENIIGGTAMICFRSTDRLVAMAAACPARRVDQTLPDCHRLFEFLAPHMASSIRMSSVLANGASTSFSHLAAIRQGVVIVRRSGRVEFANAAARQFMERTRAISINQAERLTARDERTRTYISAAQNAMRENALHALPEPSSVSVEEYGRCVIHAHIFPAEADHPFPWSSWSDPVVGCFVISGRFEPDGPLDYERLARTCGATPAEARLAQALMDGQTLSEFADDNALSRHTARNQMRALLQKSETRNQADFIRHLHRLSSPFSRLDR